MRCITATGSTGPGNCPANYALGGSSPLLGAAFTGLTGPPWNQTITRDYFNNACSGGNVSDIGAVQFVSSANAQIVNDDQYLPSEQRGMTWKPHELPFIHNGNPQLPKDSFKEIPGAEITAAERTLILEDLAKVEDGPLHLVRNAYKQLHSGGPIRVVDMIPINHALMLDGRPGIRTEWSDRNADGTPKNGLGLIDRLRKVTAEAVK